MDLSIIIVNYNVKYFLEVCLISVKKACRNIDAEIFVVDNASSDDSINYFRAFPGVSFRWNKTNEGFAKANNSILSEVKGKYILFLNPDTIVPEDCFELCIAFASRQKNFGALGVRMIDGTGTFLPESKRLFPTASATFFKLIGLAGAFPHSRLFSSYYAGHLSPDKDHQTEILAGAFFFAGKEAIEKAGSFDPDYFMYGEDIDLSYRITQQGFRNFYFAGTTIIHFKGESTLKHSPQYNRHFYGAMKLFLKKHSRNTVKNILLLPSIIIASKLAGLKKLIPRKSFFKPLILTNSAAIVCSQEIFSEIIKIVKHAVPPLMIKGRIAVKTNDTGVSLGSIHHLNPLLQNKAFTHLIYCEGELSFKEIITLIKKSNPKVNYLFNVEGSRYVVGSYNKNEQGVVIVSPETV